MSGTTSGWYPDPSGRHEQRWYDGTTWTGHVADRGVTSDDPLAPSAGGAAPAAGAAPGPLVGPCGTCGGADLLAVHLSSGGTTVAVMPDPPPGFRGIVRSIGTLRGRACLTCGAVTFAITPT
jgi:hypothetical protein